LGELRKHLRDNLGMFFGWRIKNILSVENRIFGAEVAFGVPRSILGSNSGSVSAEVEAEVEFDPAWAVLLKDPGVLLKDPGVEIFGRVFPGFPAEIDPRPGIFGGVFPGFPTWQNGPRVRPSGSGAKFDPKIDFDPKVRLRPPKIDFDPLLKDPGGPF